jgi:hypothetical protein
MKIIADAKHPSQLRKKHGIWVLRSGERLSADTVEKLRQRIQRERGIQNLGKYIRVTGHKTLGDDIARCSRG